MTTLDNLEYKPTTGKQRRFLGAKSQSEQNAPNVSALDDMVGEQLYKLVRSAYIRSKVYKNYNAESIAIKIHNPPIADQIDAHRNTALATFCKVWNVSIRKINTSTIYHFPING